MLLANRLNRLGTEKCMGCLYKFQYVSHFIFLRCLRNTYILLQSPKRFGLLEKLYS